MGPPVSEQYEEQFRGKTPANRWLPSADSRRRLCRLRWWLPIGLVALVIVYEVGPSRWIYDSLGFTSHLVAEILMFGTVGPLLTYLCLALLERWLDERDTSDLQSQLLTRAHEHVDRGRRLSDDTLQVLFAMGVLITQFKSHRPDLPPDTAVQIEMTEQALDDAIEQLRSHLME